MPAWPSPEAACLGVYALEGVDPAAGFLSLEPDEGLGFTVRFTPNGARDYEATVPIYTEGDKTAAYVQLSLSGSGTLPKLVFDVAECLLPAVSVVAVGSCSCQLGSTGPLTPVVGLSCLLQPMPASPALS